MDLRSSPRFCQVRQSPAGRVREGLSDTCRRSVAASGGVVAADEPPRSPRPGSVVGAAGGAAWQARTVVPWSHHEVLTAGAVYPRLGRDRHTCAT